MITALHNPFKGNGVKIVNDDDNMLNGFEGRMMEDIVNKVSDPINNIFYQNMLFTVTIVIIAFILIFCPMPKSITDSAENG
jgi:phosphomannomutase